jgi:uncharacterized membrane protein YfcA
MWLLLLTLLCCLQDVAGETLCDYCSQIGRACNTTLGQCIACTPTLGCTERQVCDTKTGTCAVKGLFQPFLWSDGVLIILVFLATGLSNAGGIGGGILLVPLLSLFAGFTLKNASANAQPLIFAASIANAIVNIPRRHVARDTPRIDWNLVACTVPFFLMGTTPGTFMNQAFPSYFTAFVLSALLAVLSVQSGIFGLRLLRERLRKRSKGSGSEQNASLSSVSAANGHSVELSPIASGSREGHSSVSKEDTMASTGAGQVEKADTTFANPKVPAEKLPISSTLPAANASNVSTMSSSPLLTAAPGEGVSLEDGINEPPNIGERVEQRPVMTAGQACSENQSREWLCRLDPLLCAQNHEELLAAERPWFQWRTMIFLLSCWVILFIIQLFSGSAHKSSPLGIPLCGAIYWILFGIQESALFLLGCLTIWRNLRLNILRDRLGYPWYRKNGLGDIRWTRNLIFGYPIWAFIAGIFGSWVGIGGSSLLIPFLNLVGHADPATTQSSMSISNLLGSASAAFVYLAQGRLNISYALFYGLFALLGSYTGVWMVYFLVERYQIRALFVFALTICFSVALGAMLYIAIRNTLGVEAAGVGWIFTNICAFVG